MNSIFKICSSDNCNILILGLEKDCKQYSEQEQVDKNSYKYEQSITINVVRGIEYEEDNLQPIYTSMGVDILTHSPTSIDESKIQLPKDGLYEVSHIILPTQEYFDEAFDSIEFSNGFYFYNTVSNKICKYTSTVEEIQIDEILAINPEGSSVIRSDKLTFSICRLNHCFYYLCRNLLSTFCGKCINKLSSTKQDVYNRDIVWMAINVIQYLVESEQYFEALRILQSLNSCGSSLCSVTTTTVKGGDCGCS